MELDIRSNSVMSSETPILPAIANRWIMKLVEPPTAALTLMAFSKAFLVRISDNLSSSFTISTILLPESWARTFRLASAAGMAAFSGRESPNASTIQAIEEAVPITAQWPWLRHIPASAIFSSSSVISPARKSSVKRHISLVPISLPLYLPVSIGPPDTTIVGIFTLHAPITKDGVVLSHPHNNTTPSNGFARIDSSTSILTKFL